MHQDSITHQVMERIESGSRDNVYIAFDFFDLGEYNAVRQALLRLEKAGKIQKTMYANSEDFQVLAITTMVSSFVAEWYGRSAERHHE